MAESPGIVISGEVAATAGRKAGYAAFIVLNGVFLFLANNILAWDVFPWLTDDFAEVLPALNAAIIVTMIATTVYLIADPRWLKVAGDIITSSMSIVVGIRMWQVFPFDFTGYAWDWETILRWVIALGIFGTAIAIVVNVVVLLRLLVAGPETE